MFGQNYWWHLPKGREQRNAGVQHPFFASFLPTQSKKTFDKRRFWRGLGARVRIYQNPSTWEWRGDLVNFHLVALTLTSCTYTTVIEFTTSHQKWTWHALSEDEMYVLANWKWPCQHVPGVQERERKNSTKSRWKVFQPFFSCAYALCAQHSKQEKKKYSGSLVRMLFLKMQ